MPRIIALSLLAASLAGCASAARDIPPAEASPLAYRGLDCALLDAEARRIAERANAVAARQDGRASHDAFVTALGLVAFWPALFLAKGDGPEAAELARLRGEAEAIAQAAGRAGCERPVAG